MNVRERERVIESERERDRVQKNTYYNVILNKNIS